VLGRKKGFIQWPKNGEEGILLTSPLLHPRGVEGLQTQDRNDEEET
jgi:hypothetical protein